MKQSLVIWRRQVNPVGGINKALRIVINKIIHTKLIFVTGQQHRGLAQKFLFRCCVPAFFCFQFLFVSDDPLTKANRRWFGEKRLDFADQVQGILNNRHCIRKQNILIQQLLEDFAFIRLAAARIMRRGVDRANPIPKRTGLRKSALTRVIANHGHTEGLHRVQFWSIEPHPGKKMPRTAQSARFAES